MSMTLAQLRALDYRAEVHHDRETQARGQSCYVVRVTGRVRTWKRDKTRTEVPAKWGIRGPHYTLTQHDLSDWHLASECPRLQTRLPI
jgi:hypothetical protein